jgi:hypothetical protein
VGRHVLRLGTYRIMGLVLGAVVLAAALSGCATPTGAAGRGEAPVPASEAGSVPPTGTTASPPTATGTDSGKTTGGGIPESNRAFMLQAQDRGTEEPVLTVAASGRIGTYPGGADVGDREQFVLAERSRGTMSYLLKAAKLRVGGEPPCVGVRAGVLQMVACDAGDASKFVTLAAPNGAGGPIGETFDLIVGGFNVEVGQDGKVSLKKRSTGFASTTFRFLPQGTVGEWP